MVRLKNHSDKAASEFILGSAAGVAHPFAGNVDQPIVDEKQASAAVQQSALAASGGALQEDVLSPRDPQQWNPKIKFASIGKMKV
jgi:hypothetical protein